MKNLSMIVAATLVASGNVEVRAVAQPERAIPVAMAKQDAALARQALEMIHPGLDRYTPMSEITAAFAHLDRVCEQGPTERMFYAALSVTLAKVRCSHTKAEPSAGWTKWRNESATYLPFRFVVRDGRMIVVRSATPALRTGDEVLAINGVAAGVVMAQVLSAIPADGWTDGSRLFALSSMSDLDESEMDHFLPAFVELGDSVKVEVRGAAEAAARSAQVEMLTREARAIALKDPPVPRNLDESVSLEMLEGGVGVLRVGTFVAYRKQIKPADVYRPLFERLAAEKVGTLILDLRDNGGGSDDAAIDLMRFLVAEPFSSATRQWVKTYRFGDLTERLQTWDRSVLSMPEAAFTDLGNGYFEVNRGAVPKFTPLEPVFRGRLIALCGPANASGATLFLAELQTRRTVALMGEPTGGSVAGPTAGIILFLPLPNTGIKVRIPAVRSVTGLAGSPDGGLMPDVLVRPELDDVLSGRDVVLQAAVELIRGVKEASP
jgi:C-terminal processing protease CtpA/Prc